MQCQRAVWRGACRHHNAYNAASALRATFCATTTTRSSSRSSSQANTASDSQSASRLVSLWELDQANKNGSARDALSEAEQQNKTTRPSRFIRKMRPESRFKTRNHATAQAMQIHEELVQDLTASVNEDPDEHLADREAPDPSSADFWKLQILEINARLSKYNDLIRSGGAVYGPKFGQLRRDLDYEGIVVQPQPSALDKPLPFPWALGQPPDLQPGEKLEPIRDVLESEIQRFATYAQTTRAEQAARDHVAQEVQKLIRVSTFAAGGHRIDSERFGSEVTGLAFPTSDLDFRVYDRDYEHENILATQDGVSTQSRYRAGEFMTATMQRITEYMQRPESDFICVNFRPGNYPILTAQHRHSGLDVQIVATEPKSAQHACILQYLDTYPTLKPVFTLIRATLVTRGLLDSYYGGLGSYGTLILVLYTIARLNTALGFPPPSSPSSLSPSPSTFPSSLPSPPSSATHLLHFLSLCSTLNPTTHGLTLTPRPKPFPRHRNLRDEDSGAKTLVTYSRAAKRRRDPVRANQWSFSRLKQLQLYLLALQDPADPANNLGARASAIKHILTTIRGIEGEVKGVLGQVEGWGWEDVGGGEKGESGDEEKGKRGPRMRSVLEPLVGRFHEVNLERRRKLEEFGRVVLGEGR